MKGFLIKSSLILIFAGEVDWKIINLSRLFSKSVDGEISINAFPKISCLETIFQVSIMRCTLKHFNDSVWIN